VPPELGLALIVDRTGDTFRTQVSPPGVPSPAARCLESVTEGFAFTAPAVAAKITLTLRVRDAVPPAPSK
jgi:hypothetical protein